MYGPPPSRLLLVLAGGLTQAVGVAYLILGMASLPIAHELHGGLRSVAVSIVAALGTIVCGTLVHRGRLVAIALAVGLTIGFGIALTLGTTAIGALLHILPAAAAKNIAMVGAISMFVAAGLCMCSIPVALRIRAWARQGIDAKQNNSGEADSEQGVDAVGAETSSEPDSGKPEQTLKGVGRARVPATQIIHLRRRSKSAIIIVVAATVVAIGLVVTALVPGSSKSEVIKMATSESGPTEAGHPAIGGPSLAAPRPAPIPTVPPLDDLVAKFHAAIANPESGELAPLLDANVFGFGVQAQDVAQGREPVTAILRKIVGTESPAPIDVSASAPQIGQDGQIGWFGEELRVGETTFVVTVAAGLRQNAWSIFALHWALAMPNDTAYRLAYSRKLEIPGSIPNGVYDTPLAKAMTAAFSSRPAFVAARSNRPDALNFGSAPGELSLGENTKRIFARLRARIQLHDAVNVGKIGEHGGWGAANVNYTDVDKRGRKVTQMFRVLAVWVMENDQWRIVQTHWSNGR